MHRVEFMPPSDREPPWTEAQRLAALERTGLLDTPPEQAYDDLVRLAADIVGTPMAAIHLVAADRQWGKAVHGLDTREIKLADAFCPVTMLEQDGLVVPDAAADPRFAGSALVTGAPGIRFYAGVPVLSEGLPIGALCVIDTQARRDGLDERQSFALRALAAQIGSQIALRRVLAERNRTAAALRRAQEAGGVGVFAIDGDSGFVRTTPEFCRLYGIPVRDQVPIAEIEQQVVREDAPEASGALDTAGDGALDVTFRIRRADTGELRWLAKRGEIERDATGRRLRFSGVVQDITAQREAAEALAASQQRLAALVAATSDVVFSFSPDWRVLRQLSGRGFLRDTTGANPDWLAEYIPAEDQAAVLAGIELALQTGTGFDLEHRVKMANGRVGWAHSRAVPVMGEAGQIGEWFGRAVDVTERRTAERHRDALLELADMLRALDQRSDVLATASAILGRTLGSARGGYGVVDPVRERVVVERDWLASPALASSAGLHAFRNFGSYIDDLLRGEVVAITDVASDPRTAANAERFAALQIRALLNVPLMEDGRLAAVVLAHETVARVWTEQDIAFAQGVADRTWAALEQGRIAAKLRRVNETMEQQVAERISDRNQLWRLSHDLLLIAAFDGQIVAVNPAWTEALGWTEDELVGTNLLSLIHAADVDRTADATKAISEGTSYPRFDNRYRRKDGTYAWISWAAGPGDGHIIAVGRDTTLEKEQSEALRRSEEALRQSQKMEAVGQLTGGIAHDFNNLLTGITGSLELLTTRIGQGRIKDLDRYVHAAQGAAKRAAALTHRLLAFSRRQTLDPRPTNVNRLVASMEDLIRRTVGPAIAIEVVGTAGVWPVLVDQNQLENALLNLCINARDAMPDGGRLTIETANRWLDQRAARDHELLEGQYVSLSVTDTGTGMPQEVVARAYEPFFTTKPLGQGTGLGLSMIYGFVRQSGGQVRIYSEVGQGTNVSLYLPRHLGEAETQDAVPVGLPAPRADQGETVLVVDDEPSVRMLVTEVLQELGYAALEATDGAAGLRVLQSDARVDLVVTDVGLPGGMNGRQMADAARVGRPGLKVLFITGYAENAVVSNGYLEPGTHVLTKPFAMDALASRIREIISTP